MRQSEYHERKLRLLDRIADALEAIAKELKPKVVHLDVYFGKGGRESMTLNIFTDPDVDSVPYVIQPTDGNKAPVALSPGDVVALVSTDGNSVINPNPADPSGLTGALAAKSGFSGPVSGTATYTPSGAPAPTATGSWTGTFTPGQVAALDVNFSDGVPPAASAKKR